MYEDKLTLKVGEGKISMHGNEGGTESLRDKIKGGGEISVHGSASNCTAPLPVINNDIHEVVL